jgi:hypothetical protein
VSSRGENNSSGGFQIWEFGGDGVLWRLLGIASFFARSLLRFVWPPSVFALLRKQFDTRSRFAFASACRVAALGVCVASVLAAAALSIFF